MYLSFKPVDSVVRSPPCEWVSSNLLRAWTDQNAEGKKNSVSISASLTELGHLIFSSLHMTIFFLFFPLIHISWRLITLQYYSGLGHTLIWISHGFTCVPESWIRIPESWIPLPIPSLWVILVHQPWALVSCTWQFIQLSWFVRFQTYTEFYHWLSSVSSLQMGDHGIYPPNCMRQFLIINLYKRNIFICIDPYIYRIIYWYNIYFYIIQIYI